MSRFPQKPGRLWWHFSWRLAVGASDGHPGPELTARVQTVRNELCDIITRAGQGPGPKQLLPRGVARLPPYKLVSPAQT